jgi:flavin-dependent dehydrogenase
MKTVGRGDSGDWDAVIVGSSFAGLAAAMELAGAGRVLLLDRIGIGEGQTSACATPLRVLEALRALEAVEQIHTEAVFHFPDGHERRYPTGFPFATFDYMRLCELLAARTDATFLQAVVYGYERGAVMTSRGSFRGRVLVDSSGWRAVLGSSVRPSLVDPGPRSLGLELRLGRRARGLHFWVFPPELACGIGWLFPAGGHSRVGLACYRGRGSLKLPLEHLVGEPAHGSDLHGGFFPSRLRDPVAGPIFLVGDAAGQCLPVTGEGIRPAFVFGQLAGRLARRVLAGELPYSVALAAYRRLVLEHSAGWRLLGALQRALLGAPRVLPPTVAWLFGQGPFARPAQRAYWQLASPDLLDPGGGGPRADSTDEALPSVPVAGLRQTLPGGSSG